VNRIKLILSVLTASLVAFAVLNLYVGHASYHEGDMYGVVATAIGGVFSVVLGGTCFFVVLSE
jgi:hypothetical protein